MLFEKSKQRGASIDVQLQCTQNIRGSIICVDTTDEADEEATTIVLCNICFFPHEGSVEPVPKPLTQVQWWVRCRRDVTLEICRWKQQQGCSKLLQSNLVIARHRDGNLFYPLRFVNSHSICVFALDMVAQHQQGSADMCARKMGRMKSQLWSIGLSINGGTPKMEGL